MPGTVLRKRGRYWPWVRRTKKITRRQGGQSSGKRKVGSGYGRDLYAAIHVARESRYLREVGEPRTRRH